MGIVTVVFVVSAAACGLTIWELKKARRELTRLRQRGERGETVIGDLYTKLAVARIAADTARTREDRLEQTVKAVTARLQQARMLLEEPVDEDKP